MAFDMIPSYDTTGLPDGFWIDWTASHEGPILFARDADGYLKKTLFIGIECCDDMNCDHDRAAYLRDYMIECALDDMIAA